MQSAWASVSESTAGDLAFHARGFALSFASAGSEVARGARGHRPVGPLRMREMPAPQTSAVRATSQPVPRASRICSMTAVSTGTSPPFSSATAWARPSTSCR